MSNLIIDSNNKTPSVEFGFTTGMLEIRGKSIPENSADFYQPLFDWLDNYSLSPAPETELKVCLEYFNTSSSKCLLDIFRRLEKINLSGKSVVKVLWYFEADDEDMMEAGEDYKSLVKIPFELNKE